MSLSFVLFLSSSLSAYAEDRLALGVLGGLAVQQPFDGHPSSDVQLGLVELQWSGALLQSDGHPRLQIVGALLLGESFKPVRRFMIGTTQTLRLHLAPRRAVGVYLETGAGFMQSAMDNAVSEINGRFQYVLVGGVGLRVRARNNGTLIIGYRFTHFSNHGTTLPNLGLNMHTAVIGYQLPPF